jgi:hypothetical protein
VSAILLTFQRWTSTLQRPRCQFPWLRCHAAAPYSASSNAVSPARSHLALFPISQPFLVYFVSRFPTSQYLYLWCKACSFVHSLSSRCEKFESRCRVMRRHHKMFQVTMVLTIPLWFVGLGLWSSVTCCKL